MPCGSVFSMAPQWGRTLRAAQSADPGSMSAVITQLAAELGASDVVLYLADFAQVSLEPLPDLSTHAELPHREEVATTMAGRSFLSQGPVTVDRSDGTRVWVPIIAGSDRTGVLAVTVPEATDDVLHTIVEFGLLAGYLISAHSQTTDIYNLRRRRHTLSLAASMQWDLLPPLVLKTERMSVAALLEPAYDVGGDCFDYSLNDRTFHVGLFDPLGHGVESALMAALCVGSYRHDRREGLTVQHLHTRLDQVVAAECAPKFITGQLVQIDVDTGEMFWTNAGHPPPLLIRQGKVIGELDCAPTLPWGLGDLAAPGTSPTVGCEALEPGDGVLFYTDGITEAHVAGGEQFGLDRLADLVGQQASEQFGPEEIVRHVARKVLEYQDDRLDDDATMVLFEWHRPLRS